MQVPNEHRKLLSQQDFPVEHLAAPWFSPEERETLRKFGRWMQALCTGSIAPFTDEQRHIIAAIRNETEPISEYEGLWLKYQQYQVQFTSANTAPTDDPEKVRLAYRAQLRDPETERFLKKLGIPEWDFD
jgi:uncharacterized protein YifE (UPF0438 family)